MSEAGGTVDYGEFPWRVGRTVGRTIYAVTDAAADEHDPPNDELIGLMDTPELAAEACLAHNHLLAQSGQVPC